MKPLLFSLFLLLFIPQHSFADGSSNTDWAVGKRVTDDVNRASDASFDKRLPPVLPGEEVKDSGKTMRVWSTSGSLSVSEPPSPGVRRDQIPPGVGVVVDQRGRDEKRHHDEEDTHQ